MTPRILHCAALLLAGCTAADERVEHTMATGAMKPKFSAGQRFTAKVSARSPATGSSPWLGERRPAASAIIAGCAGPRTR
ncbi:hypothetical protein AB0J72_08460 [Dactylosporangium sp. NPDC049742]|uniref:hypothetical protein n=1 Tax=Dactylosporangium sp. NPDC049742 TaxID=3154737 RepID=UPI003420A995